MALAQWQCTLFKAAKHFCQKNFRKNASNKKAGGKFWNKGLSQQQQQHQVSGAFLLPDMSLAAVAAADGLFASIWELFFDFYCFQQRTNIPFVY